ncbi:MAG: hypothetical protein MI810_20880 [Flavobacteriales bacterium]|nr:hypothetical protein [Flavobacteriales bacterium]
MSRLLVFILLLGFINSCTKEEEIESETKKDVFTDTLNFQDLKLRILFNDYGMFDTSYQLFEFDMCTPLHNSGYRLSNSKYYNEDTLIFLYDYSNDSLLNLTVYQKQKIDWITSTRQYLEFLYDARRATMKATKNEFSEPEIYETFFTNGIEIGLIGSSSPQKNGKYFTSLQVTGIIDSTTISGTLTYMGSETGSYLESFEQIAKSVVIEKL